MNRDRLLHLLEYYPDSGDFVWRVSQPGHIQAGFQAGTLIGTGYVQIQIDLVCYKAHRLAWLYVYGEAPIGSLDHINGNKIDNRISNLRLCNNSQNKANSKVSKNSKSGVKGVSWHKKTGKWMAQIGVDWKVIYLGVYDSVGEAKSVYDAAANKYQGEFAKS